jgi:hypothetical protein
VQYGSHIAGWSVLIRMTAEAGCAVPPRSVRSRPVARSEERQLGPRGGAGRNSAALRNAARSLMRLAG